MHPMLNTAVKAARQAGRLINRASLDADALHVARKERNDFVTEVDKAAEDAIIETLLGAYPRHAILAEESGLRPGSNPMKGDQLREADHLWIIDPLDGTTNFIHGLPHYCISIALMERGVVTQGLVYDPVRNELFTASRGRGAFLNDRRIRDIEIYFKMLRPVMEKAAGIRRAGAAALDMAYTAAGRFDGFFELGLKPWDVAAGSLLVTEAGGLVGDFNGNASYLESEQVVAGTPKVFSALIPLMVTPRAGESSLEARRRESAPAESSSGEASRTDLQAASPSDTLAEPPAAEPAAPRRRVIRRVPGAGNPG